MMPATAPDERAGDRGLSLVEVLVGAAVSLVVALGLVQVFAGTLRSSDAAVTRVATTTDLRQGMDVMARRMRVAVRPPDGTAAFVLAAPDEMRFYASLVAPGDLTDRPPTLVTYAVTPGCLRETLTTPTGDPGMPATWSWSPGASTVSRCLARGSLTPLPRGGGLPLHSFSYYDTVSGTTAAASTAGIVSVEVALAVQRTSGDRVPAVGARSRTVSSNLLAGP